jgi:hypothetical protein
MLRRPEDTHGARHVAGERSAHEGDTPVERDWRRHLPHNGMPLSGRGGARATPESG